MASCVDCGRWCPSEYWAAPVKATENRCAKVPCLACGAQRCHGEGTGNGRCKACLFGRLVGWSFMTAPKVCQYAGCDGVPVYAGLPGAKKHCCKKHGDALIAKRQRTTEAR